MVSACALAGALGGMWLRTVLPAHHLDGETRDTVKVGIGLVATMTALVLGLITASAKSSFDGVDAAVKEAALNVLSLDRMLARYGPETAPLRATLKEALDHRIAMIWPQNGAQAPQLDVSEGATRVEALASALHALQPANEGQRYLQARAEDIAEQLLKTRWLVSASAASSVPGPFLGILLFWLTITFASFGLFAPRHATVVVVLVVCAMSVGGAVFLVLEMDQPFQGLLKVSPDPLRYAAAQLGK
ncbi:MAG: DUF4239 domain-containing protein [bacterium]|nr:DUF4239 domain-containing protein [bacterium]